MTSSNTEANDGKVAVNGDSGAHQSQLESDIIRALKVNGGLKRIQGTFRQRLDEAGWSQDLKEYVTRLFRSGAATTYEDALKIVMANINHEGDDFGTENAAGAPVPNLTVPLEAQNGGADRLRKEFDEILQRKNGVNLIENNSPDASGGDEGGLEDSATQPIERNSPEGTEGIADGLENSGAAENDRAPPTPVSQQPTDQNRLHAHINPSRTGYNAANACRECRKKATKCKVGDNLYTPCLACPKRGVECVFEEIAWQAWEALHQPCDNYQQRKARCTNQGLNQKCKGCEAWGFKCSYIIHVK